MYLKDCKASSTLIKLENIAKIKKIIEFFLRYFFWKTAFFAISNSIKSKLNVIVLSHNSKINSKSFYISV